MEKSTQRGKSELTNNAKTETRQKHFFFLSTALWAVKSGEYLRRAG